MTGKVTRKKFTDWLWLMDKEENEEKSDQRSRKSIEEELNRFKGKILIDIVYFKEVLNRYRGKI